MAKASHMDLQLIVHGSSGEDVRKLRRTTDRKMKKRWSIREMLLTWG